MSAILPPLDWDGAPVAAFARFVVSPDFLATGKPRHHQAGPRLVSAPSARVYAAMFGRFVAWMTAQPAQPPLRLRTLDVGTLRRFLAITDPQTGRPRLASNIAYRYLRLLDRVLSHVGRQPNPARQLFEELRAQQLGAAAKAASSTAGHPTEAMTGAAPADHAMVVLDAAQLARFHAALPDAGGTPTPSGKRAYAPWKRLRDRALLCMLAGAGLKPAEAIGLRVDEFNPTPLLTGEHAGCFVLNLRPQGKHPTSFGHTAYLDAAFAPEVLAWLAERRRLGLPGELLFPSTRSGKALSAATVYLLARHTFERAGIDVARSGGRTLRNSYAVREIRRAVDKHALKDMLGLALAHSTQLYFDAARRLERDEAGMGQSAPPDKAPDKAP